MAHIDNSFKQMYLTILNEGYEYTDSSRDCLRKQIPSFTLSHNFANGFPAIALKHLNFRDVVGELIWFLRGDNDIEYLNKNGIKIWNKDAYNWYLRCGGGGLSYKDFSEKGKGSVGNNYSVQWRHSDDEVDQIEYVINEMKRNIMSTRIKLSAWNPSELNKTALPPCHDGFQIIGVPLENGMYGFELHWNQRSSDSFLGVPYNIASYSVLAEILSEITNHLSIGVEGTLKCVHLYENQIEPTKKLLDRNSNLHGNCTIKLSDRFKNNCARYNDNVITLSELFNSLEIEDVELVNYTSYPKIAVPMLAPKSI